ncbi:hypothetical protein K4F52_001476 [Lecanicillium sp. MT-2017a]|nr:hypothetical protein K4F52_001476 [Lecanicillium sp. MT-2017a]
MIGKWHLGEGKAHQPTGFDFWSVLPGQGAYFDPEFIEMGEETQEPGYATDIITEKTLQFLATRPRDRPFFVMCHHKAPHRKWECHPRHRHLYQDDVKVPDTFDDDYKNRARAAAVAKIKVGEDLDYFDLGLAQPEGGAEVGIPHSKGANIRKVPLPEDVTKLRLIDKDTGENYTFKSRDELRQWKYQRYMKRYLRTIAAIDESVGAVLNYVDDNNLSENTIVIYTSDQGFFLGDHGWFDKRFMYEESFQMPFIIRYPKEINAGSICNDIISNVDFAPTWLDLAGLKVPSYMQGCSFRPLLQGLTPEGWRQLAYHRYWMHRDVVHEAYAHYGVRNQRYKLIYWYNEGFDLPGTHEGGQDREWELFDCIKDPLELINCYSDPEYVSVVCELTADLEALMEEIGDEICHHRASI